MDLPGNAYLLALAALAIAFVGFASLVIIFIRPTTGGPLTRYDVFFTLSFVQLGFVITFGALLPPLLALGGWPAETIWRLASAFTAFLYALFCIAAPIRRQSVGQVPGPTYFAWLAIPHLVALTLLILIASGIPLGPGAEPYASALTLIFFTTGLGYYLALRVLLLASHKR